MPGAGRSYFDNGSNQFRIAIPMKKKTFDNEYVAKTIELFCDEDQDVHNSELIFYEPDSLNMIIKLTYATDFIERGGGEADEGTEAENNDASQKGESVKR